MAIEIYFGGAKVDNAPFNDKFGDAEDMNDAIAKSRAAHEEAGGNRLHVDDENVVVVQDGQNLWSIWQNRVQDTGVSWEAFLQNNMHLRDPKNLAGEEQAGWNDHWLVHEGDHVFIPDGPQPATVPEEGEHRTIAKDGDEWVFQEWGNTRPTSQTKITEEHFLDYNGVRYDIVSIDHANDSVTVKPEDDPDADPITLDLNEISQ